MPENVAYDLSLFEERTPEKSKPRLRVTPKNKGVKLRRGLAWLQAVGAGAVVLALVISVLCAQVQSTELSDQLHDQEKLLEELQSEYTFLSTDLEMKTNLTAVQTYASNVLRMVKMDRSQVTYVANDEENRVERPGSENRQAEKDNQTS